MTSTSGAWTGGADGAAATAAAARDATSSQALAGRIMADLTPTLGMGGWGLRLWVGALGVVLLAALGAYVVQLSYGLAVTGLNDHVSWGLYMANFIFFCGLSMAGTLISAVLRVTGAEWRRPITRIAEAITLFALLVGAPMVLIDMGRPDRIHHLVLYGRINSPILWDVLSINTYIVGSFLYLYVAMIPDLALLRDWAREHRPGSVRLRLYSALSLRYRGTGEQERALHRALAVLAIVIIPVAISVHTVVSWIFGMTLRPGWHSTIFGPYFVVGALFSGTAAIITAMAAFRWVYGLGAYLSWVQFRNLGRLLLVLGLIYTYFTVSEYLTIWYGGAKGDEALLAMLTGPQYGTAFWGVAIGGVVLPSVLLVIPSRRSIVPIVVASVLVNIGMWVKRYLIVVPTLMVPNVPPVDAGAISYFPSVVEWTITAGAIAAFALLFTLFFRLFPVISIWETVEGVEAAGAEATGVDLPRELADEER